MHQPHQPTVFPSEVEIIPENYFEQLNPESIFGRTAPLEVDLGCGDGTFLTQLAQANSERDYLGIERLYGRVRKAHGKIVQRELTNSRVLWIETSYATRYMLPPDSVTVFHLMFPDPWPKRRHRRRRVITEDFLTSIHAALVPGGLFRIVTDHVDYFREVEGLVHGCVEFVRTTNEPTTIAVSTFEKRFRDRDAEIYLLLLRKVSPLT